MSKWCSLGCWLLASWLLPVEPSSAGTELELVRRSQPLLGTYVVITAYGSDRAATHDAVSAAFAEIRRLDALMSLHRADSELAWVNARAAEAAVAVSPELFHVLAMAQEIAQQTDGAFDITAGPLVELWGFLWKEPRLPTAAELEAVRPAIGWRLVELDPECRTVRLRAPGMRLDLNGIAKGYAVDCALEKLQSLGVTRAMVRAGGDLRVVGVPPGRGHWLVQLEDPRKGGQRIVIPVRASALSTSGNYENYFEVDGHRYSHILDPRTGWPVEGLAACTALAPTCLESDAWATACFVYGVTNSLTKFAQRFPLRFTLMPAHPAAPGQVVASPLFPAPTGQPAESAGQRLD